jgi:hypothetical protein
MKSLEIYPMEVIEGKRENGKELIFKLVLNLKTYIL